DPAEPGNRLAQDEHRPIRTDAPGAARPANRRPDDPDRARAARRDPARPVLPGQPGIRAASPDAPRDVPPPAEARAGGRDPVRGGPDRPVRGGPPADPP